MTLEGDPALDLCDVAGAHYVRKGILTGDLLTVEERKTNSGVELRGRGTSRGAGETRHGEGAGSAPRHRPRLSAVL